VTPVPDRSGDSAPERLATERLICERLQPQDADDILAMMLDPRVGRTLWTSPHPPSEDDVLAKLRSDIAHWERHGFGIWLLRDRAGGETVGRGGLAVSHVTGIEEVEVEWAIVSERWGQGLATELALASVRVALARLALTQLIAITLPHNAASRRVMEKAGFRYDRELEHLGLPHVLYRLSRPFPGDHSRRHRVSESRC
jgi:[ribosomal protein S5]-alanine N-acetyltransferase